MQFNQHGIAGKHLVALASIALLGLLGWRAMAPEAERQIQPPLTPAVQEYEVRFWAEDGTEYEVQPAEGGE
jgi:hypothetical protein